MTKEGSSSKQLVMKITRMMVRGATERYAFPSHVRERLGALVDGAASAPHAVADVGAVLKLIHVLKKKHASPSAAEVVTEALKRSPRARRIVALHWSGGRRRPRRGADGLPVKTGLAPHVAERPKGGVSASSFMSPGRDLRSAHLEKRIMRRKS